MVNEPDRDYAIRLLRGDYTYTTQPIHHPRARYDTAEDAAALDHLSELLDWICSKLLHAEIPLVLPGLRADGTLDISDTCAQHLPEISPATIDRLRARRRPKGQRRRGVTKPGTWLKYRIPVRSSAERNPTSPGYLDVDLVDHYGGRASGEFINDQLYRYCKSERLKFTRGRAGQKNDNARVEQKNWSVVRQLVGYGRYGSQAQVDQLNRVYAVARLYVNFFKPVMKLKARRRVGSKIKRIYDDPKTPYQRC